MIEGVLLKKGISYYCSFSFTERYIPINGKKKRAEKLKLPEQVHGSVHGFKIGPKTL
jgi:hypothetical protein